MVTDITQLTAISILILIHSWIIGSALTRITKLSDADASTKTLMGLAVSGILSSSAFRASYPITTAIPFYFVLYAIFIFFILLDHSRYEKEIFKTALKRIATYIILTSPLQILFYLPLTRGSYFFGNIDPGDLHILSANLILGGSSWSDIVSYGREIEPNKYWWDISGLIYKHPDYRISIVYDYVVYAARWLTPLLSAQLSSLTSNPTIASLHSICSASAIITTIVLYDYFFKLKHKVSDSIGLTYISLGSSLVLLWNESLLPHLMALPFFFYSALNGPSIILNKNDKRLPLIAIFISTLFVTWSESVVILVLYVAAYVFLRIATKKYTTPTSTDIETSSVLNRSLLVILLTYIANPPGAVDSMAYIYSRIVHGHEPGILNFGWDLLDILAPIKTFRVSGSSLDLLVKSSNVVRILESFIMLALIIAIFFKRKDSRLLMSIASSFCILFFSTQHQSYTFWNVTTILQPVLVAGFIPSSIKPYPTHKPTIRILAYLLYMSSITSFILGTSEYLKTKYDFPVANRLNIPSIINNSAVATYSNNRHYLDLARSGKFFWLNRIGTWRGHFVTYPTDYRSLPVLVYFNCSLEPLSVCANIKNDNPQITGTQGYYDTGYKVLDLLGDDGIVDYKKLESLLTTMSTKTPIEIKN